MTQHCQKPGVSTDTLLSEKNPDVSHCDDDDITSIIGSKIPSTSKNGRSKSSLNTKKFLAPLLTPQHKNGAKILRKNYSMQVQGEELSAGLAPGRPKKSTFALKVDQAWNPSTF